MNNDDPSGLNGNKKPGFSSPNGIERQHGETRFLKRLFPAEVGRTTMIND
jgi:hypothetical protein